MHKRVFLMAAAAAVALAHPMGNFSVNHYARFTPAPGGIRIHYVLDLAEIPAFELMQDWGEGADTRRKALEQANAWAKNLRVTVDGRPVRARVDGSFLTMSEGAANMKVVRIASELFVGSPGGTLAYEDGNFAGRSGWKEIVLPGKRDRSQGLTAYPQDPLLHPPQDVRATFRWTTPTVAPKPPVAAPSVAPVPPAAAPVVAPAPAGTVVRGDFLSQLLHRTEIGWRLTFIGMAAAFGLGAMHALSPGHGKTVVAAYLVGSRGTVKHAALLGVVVTITHTASVFLLGLITLFLSRYVVPERLFPILGAISGLSIVWIGSRLFLSRWRARRLRRAHAHTIPEGEITLGSLIALGASGGLVPCPSALVVLLSAISVGRVGLGLTLLIGFSTGLAMVLMAVGVAVLFAGNLFKSAGDVTTSRAFRLAPVASAAVITCIGLVMTGVALGIVGPIRGI